MLSNFVCSDVHFAGCNLVIWPFSCRPDSCHRHVSVAHYWFYYNFPNLQIVDVEFRPGGKIWVYFLLLEIFLISPKQMSVLFNFFFWNIVDSNMMVHSIQVNLSLRNAVMIHTVENFWKLSSTCANWCMKLGKFNYKIFNTSLFNPTKTKITRYQRTKNSRKIKLLDTFWWFSNCSL